MTPDLQLHTPRLTLRLIQSNECAQLATLIQTSPSLYPWIDWCHHKFSVTDADDFVLHTRLNWVKNIAYGFGVFTKDNDELIGMAALTDQAFSFNMGTAGYWIGDTHQQQGYAKEATQAVIDFCFSQLKLTRIEFVCAPDNLASHNVALACGAKSEGLARNRYIFNAQPKDGLVFSIIPTTGVSKS
ncbi:GNAT family N-acetyltransferase [Vibrio rumoiensis]|uniref:Ribosomal-protein-serine acetyltransferase n=1 Tax=Vibrio rumoiensis 1S-45 TaxID=1188252 RepID=A0A1E5DZW7_9VIBR|nr:GNAT family protein [Vibrio rumoiensis]OEF23536.1 ribosomal-protein-serine acetyltransferase [Vibrio rumoiensis 1S-45]